MTNKDDKQPHLTVTSNNQSGGITAGSVNIYGQPRKNVTDETISSILEACPGDRPFKVFPTISDGAARQVADEIIAGLRRRGKTIAPDCEYTQVLGYPYLKEITFRDEDPFWTILVGDVSR